jgi:hypothetical protein
VGCKEEGAAQVVETSALSDQTDYVTMLTYGCPAAERRVSVQLLL